jgi:D-threonate/D-erythronate kinase
MPTLRLMADDLTGALDTAAEFVGLTGPVEVHWNPTPAGALPPSAALDTGSRERTAAEAVAAVEALAPALRGADIAYKKLDSLLRGNTVAEAAACFRLGGWRRGVFAPAFPYQGRVTRDGRQFARDSGGGWAPVGGDLVASFAELGVPAQTRRAGDPLPPGLTVFDAETDADLARVVALGRRAAEPVLWCGSGGLARALAGDAATRPFRALRPPVLGLFGSDQAVTARQLAACGDAWVKKLADGGPASVALLQDRLATRGAALASLDLPENADRATAAERIGAEFGRLVRTLPRPGTLIAAGGETLKALCLALGARCLEAVGQVAPGVPRSVLRGGAWDGLDVVSKSGAFGGDALWRDLLAGNGLHIGSNEAS